MYKVRMGFNPWFRKIPWRRKWQPLQYSCLENPMDRVTWYGMVHGVTKSRHDWATQHVLLHMRRGCPSQIYITLYKNHVAEKSVNSLNHLVSEPVPRQALQIRKLVLHLFCVLSLLCTHGILKTKRSQNFEIKDYGCHFSGVVVEHSGMVLKSQD